MCLNVCPIKGLPSDPLQLGGCPESNAPKTTTPGKARLFKFNNTVWNCDELNTRPPECLDTNTLKFGLFPKLNAPKTQAVTKALLFKFNNTVWNRD